jgi:exopolysaccharide production protein ExoZ
MTIKRFDYIDALRGYAILGVIAVHTAQRAPSLASPLQTWLNDGARGVQLFFVASALTLMFSWHARNDGAVNFYIRRFFRIAPMFYLAIVAFVLLDGYGPRYYAPRGIGWWQILSTTFFVNGWHPESLTSVVPGCWSIANEMTFYLVFPLLALRIRSFRAACAALVGFLLVALISKYPAALFWQSMLPKEDAYLAHEFVFLWFLHQAPCFLFGIAAFFAIEKWRVGKAAANRWLVAAIALILVLPFIPGTFTLYPLAFAVAAFLMANGAGAGTVVNPFIRFVGKVSFSAYLWHFAILDVIDQLAKRGFDPIHVLDRRHALPFYLVFAPSILAVTLLASSLTYRSIEQPMVRFGSRLVSLQQKAREAAAIAAARPLVAGPQGAVLPD